MDEYTFYAELSERLPPEQVAAIYLTRPEGSFLLQYAATLPGSVADRILPLRKKFSVYAPEYAALAAEIVVARERAKRRGFTNADQLFFTEDALAQATSPGLAAYRAKYLAPFGMVADLCCGAGMDAIALAAAGARVIAVDIDPVRLLFARANAEVRGVADRITFLDEPVEALGWTDANAAFFDPARRTDAGRVSKHGDRYMPPLDFLHIIRKHVRGGCAKLSPALPDDVLRELASSRLEFLSENRECKEACVWFGEATGSSGSGDEFAAVLLPNLTPPAPLSSEERGESVGGNAALAGVPISPRLPPLLRGEGGGGGEVSYLLDPDPAILRAGALDTLCERTDALRISPDDAYLQTDALPAPEWARAASVYTILAIIPYTPKKVSPWLRTNGYTRIVVKKRYYPHEPDVVARELGVSVRGDGKEITLVLVRESAKRFLAVLCAPVPSDILPTNTVDSPITLLSHHAHF